jgi:D-alanyl-D-alanine carboxypeptidase
MKKLILYSLLFLSACHVTGQSDFSNKEMQVEKLMNEHIVHEGKRPVHNFLIYAKNEKTGLEISKGIGTIGRNNTEIEADYQFNIASITKTLVATIILQLEEEGKLSVNDKAGKYLKGIGFLRFGEIHRLNDTSYANEITIKNLLQHTSGIADIFTDAATRFNISVLLHKRRQYTTEMIINKFYKLKLNKKPFNKPGQGYHYSDINYMLLGFIIEQITEKSLAQAIRDRILVKLNMNDTYFEYYEPERGSGKRIDAFLNKINMTKKINTSYEWAGGGLVSTTKDMATFIESLFKLELFQRPETLTKMIDFSNTKKYGSSYGMGIYEYKLNGKVFYGHGGFYGSILAYDPIDKITFSANIGQANPPYDAGKLVEELMDIILSN